MKRFFAVLAGVVVLSILVTGWSYAAEVYKWDMPFYNSRGTKDFKVLEKWCADLKVASGGRFDIKPLGGGEVLPVIETFEATSKGMFKINFSYDSYWTGKVPVAGFASGLPPFTLPTRENWTVLYNSYGLEALLQKAYGEHNIHYVRAIPTNNCVMLSKFPIRTAADFKGKKLRATGLYAEVLALAGASPVFFPFGEIYGALEKGAIEGVAVGPLSAQTDSAFHEVSKAFLATPLTPVDAFSVHVNKDAWNALPDDLKGILYAFCSHASELFTNHYFNEDAIARDKITKKPYNIIETRFAQKDIDIMTKHGMAVIDKYSAKDKYFAEAAAMLKKYKAALGI